MPLKGFPPPPIMLAKGFPPPPIMLAKGLFPVACDREIGVPPGLVGRRMRPRGASEVVEVGGSREIFRFNGGAGVFAANGPKLNGVAFLAGLGFVVAGIGAPAPPKEDPNGDDPVAEEDATLDGIVEPPIILLRTWNMSTAPPKVNNSSIHGLMLPRRHTLL